MKNIFKIVTIASCLTSLYQASVAAAEDAILREQQEISNRVSKMSEQNWQAYTNTQETPHKQKVSKQEHNRKQGKQEHKGQSLKAEGKCHLRDIFGWYANKVNVKYTEAKQIGTYDGGNLYVCMDALYRDDPQWKSAFDKGFATHAIGHNGIKFLDSVIELKIRGDARLYTTTLHKNDQGDYIAILNKEGRHKEISRKTNKNGFEIRDCPSKPYQK